MLASALDSVDSDVKKKFGGKGRTVIKKSGAKHFSTETTKLESTKNKKSAKRSSVLAEESPTVDDDDIFDALKDFGFDDMSSTPKTTKLGTDHKVEKESVRDVAASPTDDLWDDFDDMPAATSDDDNKQNYSFGASTTTTTVKSGSTKLKPQTAKIKKKDTKASMVVLSPQEDQEFDDNDDWDF